MSAGVKRWGAFGIVGILLGGLGAQEVGAVTGPHDMSRKAPNGQVCIVCHTPHKAPSSPLLWNHVLSSGTFSWSDWTKTTGGTSLPTNLQQWSGSSKLCLSCHDGTVDVGAIYWPSDSNFDARKITGDRQLGPNLRGNHPVGVPYPYNGARNTYNGITTGELALQSGWKAVPSKVKLFIDPSVAGQNNRGIECASCHDPHGTPGLAEANDYLRDTARGSQLCLDCHTK